MSTASATTLGKPVSRIDGRAKVTGNAKYAAEFGVAGCLHAVAVGATIARGKVTAIDTAAARKLPGIVEIFTHENMPSMKQPAKPPQDRPVETQPGQRFVPMQSDVIRYAGQFVAVVIGETLEQAQAAADAVKISYAEDKGSYWDGEMGEPPEEKPAEPKQNLPKPDYNRGDFDAAFAAAAVKLEPAYTLEQETHNPMEMSATIAVWQGDKLTAYTATQGVVGVKKMFGEVLGIPEDNIKILCPYVGGGFGCKGSVWPHEYLTAAMARELQRPVKWVLTRRQMFTAVGHRPAMLQKIQIAADPSGKLQALAHHTFNATATYGDWVESAAQQTMFLYSCPNVRTSHRLAPIDTPMPCQMRAPGHAPGTWALEVALDELAYAVNKDPLDIRLLNYSERDEGENKEFTSKQLRACYQQAADRFGWSKRSHAPRSMRDGRLLLGWGLATATYPANEQAASARVQLLTDGTAKVSIATQDLGTGTYTILAQIAADRLGLPVEKVRVDIGNSTLPSSPTSGGSTTAATAGNAVWEAAGKAREALTKAAAQMGIAADKLDVPALMKKHGAAIEGTVEKFGQKNKEYSAHSHGVQIIELTVDPDTREIRIRRVVSRFAAGRILNHKTAHSQIMGGIVMGLGAGLLEQTHYYPGKIRPVNDNLADYAVPVNKDIPLIDCDFVDEPDERINPLGVKGVGELGITGVAAAVANAIFHATGKRIRRLPVTLDMLL